MEIALYLIFALWSSITDVQTRRISNSSVLIFAATFWFCGNHEWKSLLLAALLLIALRYLTRGGLGYGDIKLSMALALHCSSSQELILALFYSCAVATIVLLLLGFFRRTWPTSLAFAPYLWLGFLTSL